MKGFTIYSNCPICGQEREGFIEIEGAYNYDLVICENCEEAYVIEVSFTTKVFTLKEHGEMEATNGQTKGPEGR